jgi:hypothetical protein
MGFNITSWGQRGRGWGRGSSPPRGSIEWIAVGDMYDPTPPGSPQASGAKPYTDLDAAGRWIYTIDRNVKQSRKIHGDKVLSRDDESSWNKIMTRWSSFQENAKAAGGFEAAMSKSRKSFDDLMDDAKKTSDGFAGKGLPVVPPPYLGEIAELLAGTPTKLDVQGMASKLVAASRCGEKLLDERSPWSRWTTSDPKPLQTAIDQARKAAGIYAESKQGTKIWNQGEPAYDEFLRRLRGIWIAGASLHGLMTPKASPTASSGGEVPLAHLTGKSPHRILWLLGAAGAGYLGIFWLVNRKPKTTPVGVPDAIPPEYNIEDDGDDGE